jgi:hypothetical protein
MSMSSLQAQRLAEDHSESEARRRSPLRGTPAHRSVFPDGPLCLPLTVTLAGKPVNARLVATISSSIVLGEGTPNVPRRSITVQELVGAQVELDDGRRLPIADDALYTLMKQRAVELDWTSSSPPQVSPSGFLGLLGAGPLITVDGSGFRLRKRGEAKRFHAGVVAIHHPERTRAT